MKRTFVHFEIPADDVARAKTFYEELLGWRIIPAEGFGGYYYVMTSDDDNDLHGGMMIREGGEVPVYYINIEDIDAYIAKLQTLGGELVAPKSPVPGMGWIAHFRDPENNLFGLWQADKNAK